MKSTGALIVARKEIGLEVNCYKAKYVVMPRDQNAGRSHKVKSGNSCFERVEQSKYLKKKHDGSKLYSGRN
jgi:hypothetical protein